MQALLVDGKCKRTKQKYSNKMVWTVWIVNIDAKLRDLCNVNCAVGHAPCRTHILGNSIEHEHTQFAGWLVDFHSSFTLFATATKCFYKCLSIKFIIMANINSLHIPVSTTANLFINAYVRPKLHLYTVRSHWFYSYIRRCESMKNGIRHTTFRIHIHIDYNPIE